MNYKNNSKVEYVTIWILCLLLLLNLGCANTSKEKFLNLQKVTPVPDNEKLIAKIDSLGVGDKRQRERVFNQIIQYANETSDNKAKISKILIEKTKKLCSVEREFISTSEDFYKLGNMANILAMFQNLEAIDMLIDCTYRRSSVGGLSNANYPTMSAVIKYQELAFPYLRKKLLTSDDNHIKCNVANILQKIGGDTAKSILKESKKTENDPNVLRCIDNYFEAL